MTLRFASIGSGSKGNCLVAEADGTRVLVDCGLSPRETERRLARIGLAPADLAGILVTHEHDDHAGQAYPFAAQHKLQLPPDIDPDGKLQALVQADFDLGKQIHLEYVPLMFVLGLWPRLILDVINPTVVQMVEQLKF